MANVGVKQQRHFRTFFLVFISNTFLDSSLKPFVKCSQWQDTGFVNLWILHLIVQNAVAPPVGELCRATAISSVVVPVPFH